LLYAFSPRIISGAIQQIVPTLLFLASSLFLS
jgi:hypothetical protein